MAIAERLMVLDPTIGPDAGGLELAQRPASLRGKTVGLMENSKPNSDHILAYVGEILQERYGVAELVFASKGDSSTSAPNETLDDLVRRCHFAVTGIGD
ncbi:MAG: hypothetical protein QF719_09320 [Chloroflexota bacterium]|jgi:hypothetical protein|nr:hypothetical protein [Chloroflexota bacterium]MDP6508641.1 hypothetical protein [Chloroflexota bacterium]MDP6758389.1 hypothetical protein [Chloroflexota bacterium]